MVHDRATLVGVQVPTVKPVTEPGGFVSASAGGVVTTSAVVAVAGVPTSPMTRPQTTDTASAPCPTSSPHPVRQREPSEYPDSQVVPRVCKGVYDQRASHCLESGQTKLPRPLLS